MELQLTQARFSDFQLDFKFWTPMDPPPPPPGITGGPRGEKILFRRKN